MNSLEERLQKDLVEAMKSHQNERVAAIRSIKTAIQVEKTTGSYHELSDSDILKIINKLSKQRQESYDIYIQAGRTEAAEKELNEKKFLDAYLPKMLSESEMNTIIETTISSLGASSMKDMGRVMKSINEKYAGQIDSKYISTKVKEKLC